MHNILITLNNIINMAHISTKIIASQDYNTYINIPNEIKMKEFVFSNTMTKNNKKFNNVFFNITDNYFHCFEIINNKIIIKYSLVFDKKIIEKYYYEDNDYYIFMFIEDYKSYYYNSSYERYKITDNIINIIVFNFNDINIYKNIIHLKLNINIHYKNDIKISSQIKIYKTNKYILLLRDYNTYIQNNNSYSLQSNLSTTHIYDKNFKELYNIPLKNSAKDEILDCYNDIIIYKDNTYYNIKNNVQFDKGNFIAFIDEDKILEKNNSSLIIKKIIIEKDNSDNEDNNDEQIDDSYIEDNHDELNYEYKMSEVKRIKSNSFKYSYYEKVNNIFNEMDPIDDKLFKCDKMIFYKNDTKINNTNYIFLKSINSFDILNSDNFDVVESFKCERLKYTEFNNNVLFFTDSRYLIKINGSIIYKIDLSKIFRQFHYLITHDNYIFIVGIYDNCNRTIILSNELVLIDSLDYNIYDATNKDILILIKKIKNSNKSISFKFYYYHLPTKKIIHEGYFIKWNGDYAMEISNDIIDNNSINLINSNQMDKTKNNLNQIVNNIDTHIIGDIVFLQLTKTKKQKKYNNNECCICMEEIKQKIALIPCGHTQYCNKCIISIDKCSLCNKPINGVLNLFL